MHARIPVKDSSFLQHVSKINVGIQEIGIQCHGLFEMVYGQPDFTLGVKNASQVTPCHCKVRPRFDGLQVTSLHTRKNIMLGDDLQCISTVVMR